MSESLYSYQQKMMQSNMKNFIVFFWALFLNCPVFATEIPMDIAVLRGLDKVTGRISTFSIPIGQSGQFGKTFVVPEACYTRPPEESPEDSVFLYVFEKSLKGENIELFKGWMFSSNPALSSMEHPVYDIWVIGCEKDASKSIDENEDKKVELDSVKEETDVALEPKTVENEASTENQTSPSSALVPSDVEMEEL